MKKRKALSSKKRKKEKEDKKKGSTTKKIKYKSSARSKDLESLENIDESPKNKK